MPTNLERLRVSLTKHGAHKLAYLIINFDKDEILNNTWGKFNDIHIDAAQASNILSQDSNGEIPSIWNDIRKYGEQDIYDIVFIANVFSHVDLINTMIDAINRGCVIDRGRVIDGKAYTNFAHTIDQFDYSIEHTPDFISFDISRIFYKFYLAKHIAKIFEIKLLEAGWKKDKGLIEECLVNRFNDVFGLSADEFKIWLDGALEVDEKTVKRSKAKRNFKSGIKFKTGHHSKFEGEISVKQHEKNIATLLHNKIQNEVYKLLTEMYPDDEIGSEVPSNSGSIDLVRKQNDKFFFYEIKTTDNTKINIRQAISQLLEYAYWNDIKDIEALIIVAPSSPTEDSINYLKILRERFGLPMFYQQYDIENKILEDIS